MTTKAPLLRARTHKKKVDIKMDRYKPRDWDYQSPKHQILPHHELGRGKKRVANPSPRDYPLLKELPKTATNFFYKRELKPAIYRSYILSQILTLPGTVKVEESKVNDDQNKKDRIKVVRNKNLCYLNKLMYDYESNAAFLPDSKNNENKLKKGKSCGDFKTFIQKTDNKEKEKAKLKVFSPQRNRIKRKIKLKK